MFIEIVSEMDPQGKAYAHNDEFLCQECFKKHPYLCDTNYIIHKVILHQTFLD